MPEGRRMNSEQNQQLDDELSPWRVCVAPMLDWTDAQENLFNFNVLRLSDLVA